MAIIYNMPVIPSIFRIEATKNKYTILSLVHNRRIFLLFIIDMTKTQLANKSIKINWKEEAINRSSNPAIFTILKLSWQIWLYLEQRPLEALKQVEAKNLSSSSASLKKLRPGAVLTSTQFRANTNKHVHMRTCLFLFARNWVEVSTAPGPSFLKLFLNFLKLFTCPKQKF